MFFRILRLLALYLTVLLLPLAALPEARADRPVPVHLESCLNGAVSELALIDGSRSSVLKLFAKYVDREALGRATYGVHWKTAKLAWKDVAIKLYFDLLYSKGTKAKGAASVIKINKRLADEPDRGGDGSRGYWHIVFSAQLSSGYSVSAAVLLTDNCKVLDLSPGIWLSSLLEASDVDQALRP